MTGGGSRLPTALSTAPHPAVAVLFTHAFRPRADGAGARAVALPRATQCGDPNLQTSGPIDAPPSRPRTDESASVRTSSNSHRVDVHHAAAHPGGVGNTLVFECQHARTNFLTNIEDTVWNSTRWREGRREGFARMP